MAQSRRIQAIAPNTPITASGSTGPVKNPSTSGNPNIVAVLSSPNAPTGTGPSLTVTVLGSIDGTTFYVLYSFTAISAAQATPQRQVIQNVLEPWLQVNWTVSAAASFSGVACDILTSSPDF